MFKLCISPFVKPRRSKRQQRGRIIESSKTLPAKKGTSQSVAMEDIRHSGSHCLVCGDPYDLVGHLPAESRGELNIKWPAMGSTCDHTFCVECLAKSLTQWQSPHPSNTRAGMRKAKCPFFPQCLEPVMVPWEGPRLNQALINSFRLGYHRENSENSQNRVAALPRAGNERNYKEPARMRFYNVHDGGGKIFGKKRHKSQEEMGLTHGGEGVFPFRHARDMGPWISKGSGGAHNSDNTGSEFSENSEDDDSDDSENSQDKKVAATATVKKANSGRKQIKKSTSGRKPRKQSSVAATRRLEEQGQPIVAEDHHHGVDNNGERDNHPSLEGNDNVFLWPVDNRGVPLFHGGVDGQEDMDVVFMGDLVMDKED